MAWSCCGGSVKHIAGCSCWFILLAVEQSMPALPWSVGGRGRVLTLTMEVSSMWQVKGGLMKESMELIDWCGL